MFGPLKGKGGDVGGKTDEQLINDLISIHNAENWLGVDGEPSAPLKEEPSSLTVTSEPTQVVAIDKTIPEAKVLFQYKIYCNILTYVSSIRLRYPPKLAMNRPIAALIPAR